MLRLKADCDRFTATAAATKLRCSTRATKWRSWRRSICIFYIQKFGHMQLLHMGLALYKGIYLLLKRRKTNIDIRLRAIRFAFTAAIRFRQRKCSPSLPTFKEHCMSQPHELSPHPTAAFQPTLRPLALAVLLAAGGLSLPASSQAQDAVEAQAEQDTRLGTVTVNARRREETAQEVPTPISVLGGEALESQRVYRVQDLQQLVPSTNVAYVHARQSSISIRGLGNNPASDGLEGSVGVYLDNVYLGRPGMAVFDLLDVEQLEVLRGPQGTLFGKNTTAGVLNITTRKPTFHREGSIQSSLGEDGYW